MSWKDLPPHLKLKQLYDGLKESKVSAIVEGTRSYLDPKVEDRDVLREEDDEEDIPKLLSLASEALVLKGDLWTKKAPKGLKIEIQRGLETIELIDNLSKDPPKAEDTFLLRLLACSDPRDSWMTPTSSSITDRLCLRYSSRLVMPNFIIDQILKDTIRPLFSKSRPATITPAARKAINPQARRPNEPSDIDPSSKPWKFENPATITLFRWAIEHADSDLLSQNWPLFIPPLLTILDDPTTELRARGSELLSTLLTITPAKLLKQTGLGEVFENAVMPTLLYLPSLTPTDESLRLLKPAYKALFDLADLRYPETTETSEKMKFYDQIMRQGIFQGHLYASQNIQIVELLISEMGMLVSMMGIYAVKHLKDILPILTTRLTDPFITSSPSLLLTTIQTTRTLIQNTWPRISTLPHRNTLLNALCTCWTRIHLPESKVLLIHETIEKELRITGHLLTAAISSSFPEINMHEELKPLLETDSSFAECFFSDDGVGR